jgi:hypothetical protein
MRLASRVVVTPAIGSTHVETKAVRQLQHRPERYQVAQGNQETPYKNGSVCICSFREVTGEHLLLLTHLSPPSAPTIKFTLCDIWELQNRICRNYDI